MTPHKQKLKHSPDEGIWGDCWRTAYACVLDLPDPELVPHFVRDNCDGLTAHQRIEEWAGSLGLRRIVLPFLADNKECVLTTVGGCNAPGITYLLGGTSASGCNHVVVCQDGWIVHDPAQDDSGIVGPCEDGLYWVEFLVRDPL